MKNKSRCIEVRTEEGKVILVLNLLDNEITVKDGTEVHVEQKTGEMKGQTGNRMGENNSMTVAQKRYLFRILAERGLETDAAHEHLIELFQVDSLAEVTKFEASNMIERLIEEKKGGSNGPPF